MLLLVKEPTLLMNIASNFYNIAFGASCWHVVIVNTTLLPKPLRPHWSIRAWLIAAGVFFWVVAYFSSIKIYADLAKWWAGAA
jgi:hypothetical protein